MVTHTHKTFTINNVVATTIKIVRSNFFLALFYHSLKHTKQKTCRKNLQVLHFYQ